MSLHLTVGVMKIIKINNRNYEFHVSFENILEFNGNPRDKFTP